MNSAASCCSIKFTVLSSPQAAGWRASSRPWICSKCCRPVPQGGAEPEIRSEAAGQSAHGRQIDFVLFDGRDGRLQPELRAAADEFKHAVKPLFSIGGPRPVHFNPLPRIRRIKAYANGIEAAAQLGDDIASPNKIAEADGV